MNGGSLFNVETEFNGGGASGSSYSTEPGLEPLHFLKLKDGLFYWLSTYGLESGTLMKKKTLKLMKNKTLKLMKNRCITSSTSKFKKLQSQIETQTSNQANILFMKFCTPSRML